MMIKPTRRNVLQGTLLAGIATFSSSIVSDANAAPDPKRAPWARATYIQAKVRAPRFGRRVFNIVDYGAVEGGEQPCTEAIAAAIAACAASRGGGQVLVPPGNFLTGPIHLASNVNLHISQGATLLFSTTPADYLPAVLTRFEGMELYNYSPLIYAYDCENVAVTGDGTLDGQADNTNWWPWKGKAQYGWVPGTPEQSTARDRLIAQVAAGTPVEERIYGEGDYLRSSFIQPYKCRNVWIQGVTILRSPMWEVHPVLCENVLVEEVTINTHGPNNDGCNPESCSMVVIQDCTFSTGDDCIAIKAGRNNDGRRVGVPTTDVLIQNCSMADGHGGITIGSEMSGGVANVFARDCSLSSPNLDIALRFKTNSVRGGYIRGFWARDITVGTVAKAAIDIDFYYEEGPGHGFNPDVSDINVADMTVQSARQSLNISGYPDCHIRGLRLSDIDFGSTQITPRVEYVDDVVIEDVYENGQPLTLS